MDRPVELHGLGGVLEDMFRRRVWREGAVLGHLARRWPEVVGDRLASECRPVRLDAGVLTVASNSAVWGAQISFLSEGIRARANEIAGAGDVEKIRVVIDAPGVSEPRERPWDGRR